MRSEGVPAINATNLPDIPQHTIFDVIRANHILLKMINVVSYNGRNYEQDCEYCQTGSNKPSILRRNPANGSCSHSLDLARILFDDVPDSLDIVRMLFDDVPDSLDIARMLFDVFRKF